PQAAAVGYNTQTYGPNITVANTVDPASSFPAIGKNGSNWAQFTFYGTSWTNIGYVQNSDGSVTCDGTGQGFGNGLATACAGPGNGGNRLQFTGTAFGPGDFQCVMRGNCPMSFWANDLETMNGTSVNAGPFPWPNQASGFGNWTETDIAEFDNTNSYGLSFHNWYGFVGSNDNTSSNFNKQSLFQNPLPDYTQYQTYGMLWVPAMNGNQGYAKYYYNNQLSATTTWNAYNPNNSPPPT